MPVRSMIGLPSGLMSMMPPQLRSTRALPIAGISVIAKAGKANYSETARIGFNVFAGIVIAALGAGAISYAVFGKSLLSFFGFNTEG